MNGMRLLFSIPLLLLFFSTSLLGQEKDNAVPVQKQLDAYNNRDIDKFLAAYNDDVKVFNHPKDIILEGKEAMRERYTRRFESSPDLHCTLLNRMVLGDVVIDQEYVIQVKGGPMIQVIAMYKVKNGLIQEVYFIRPELDSNE